MIWAVVIPLATHRTTVETGILRWRMHARPPMRSASNVIRAHFAMPVVYASTRPRIGAVPVGYAPPMSRLDVQPSRLQDLLSQRWVITTGRRVEPDDIPWLMGPYGNVAEIGEAHIQRLVETHGLVAERCSRGAGLMESMSDLITDETARRRLLPSIASFYERTADYELDVWSEWSSLFGPFGRIIRWLYSRRLQQLDLPQRPLDTSHGISSAIIRLRDPATGEIRHTVWHRTLRKTGQVVYSGHYTTCDAPAGLRCAKVIFPLPAGNATVILAPRIDDRGHLELLSSGETFGDPGFYFLLCDRSGQHWARYIRSFRERITVFEDDQGALRTDHELTLFHRRVLALHYRIRPAPPGAATADAAPPFATEAARS